MSLEIVDEAPMIQKSTAKNRLRKQRPAGTECRNDVVYQVSPVLPQRCKASSHRAANGRQRAGATEMGFF